MAIIKQNVRGLHEKVLASAKNTGASKETIEAAAKIEQQIAKEGGETGATKAAIAATEELVKLAESASSINAIDITKVRELMDRGADLNIEITMTTPSRPGESVKFTPIFIAIIAKDQSLVANLIGKGADLNKPMTMVDSVGNTVNISPLYMAVNTDAKDIVDTLISNGARNEKGTVSTDFATGAVKIESSLFAATSMHKKDIIDIFHNAGLKLTASEFAELSSITTIPSSGTTSGPTIDPTATQDFIKFVRNIKTVTSPSDRDNIKQLLDRGADVNGKTGKLGKTALFKASEFGDTELIKLLLKHQGIDVTIKDWKFKTAADYATDVNTKNLITNYAQIEKDFKAENYDQVIDDIDMYMSSDAAFLEIFASKHIDDTYKQDFINIMDQFHDKTDVSDDAELITEMTGIMMHLSH